MLLSNGTGNTTAPALVPSATVNYSIRLAAQIFGILVFTTFYSLSWVIIFYRKVPQSLLYHARACCNSTKAPVQQRSNLLPPIPCFILIITNVLLLFRHITWVITAAQSIMNIIIHVRPDVVSQSPFLQNPQAEVFLEQFGLGTALMTYLMSTTSFGLLLVLWSRILSTQIARSKAQSIIYNSLIVLTVLAVIVVHLGSTPALVNYFGQFGLRNPIVTNITVYYICIPTFVAVIAFLVLLMFIIGIRMRSGLASEKAETTSRTVKVLVAKVSLALAMIPFAMCVRAVGLIIFALQIYFWSYMVAIFIISFIPDILISLGIFICFWPFKSAILCCSFDNCTGNNASVLMILFNPLTNQDMLDNYEQDKKGGEMSEVTPQAAEGGATTAQNAAPVTDEVTPSTPSATVELLPPQEDTSAQA